MQGKRRRGGPSRDDWTTPGMTRKSTSAGKEKKGEVQVEIADYIRDDMKEYKCREREEGGGLIRDGWTTSGMT